MTFIARLKKTSTIWHTWRSARRIQGDIAGVPFRLSPGLEYITSELSGGQVTALKFHNSVVLEMTSNAKVDPVDMAVFAVAANEPVPQPEPALRPAYQPPQQQQRYQGKGRR